VLQLAVRGRAVNRDFGGDSITDLGTIDLTSQARFAQPALAFGPVSRDRTRQLDLGLTLEERWQGVGSFAVGVLDDHYHRSVWVPDTGPDEDRTTPRLVNMRLTIDAARTLLLYSSFVQGLEDSALAPSLRTIATSRRQRRAAARSTADCDGRRGAIRSDCRGFDIRKPYFNVDAENIYTQLGRLEYAVSRRRCRTAMRGSRCSPAQCICSRA